jgi:hypothetical protein
MTNLNLQQIASMQLDQFIHFFKTKNCQLGMASWACCWACCLTKGLKHSENQHQSIATCEAVIVT